MEAGGCDESESSEPIFRIPRGGCDEGQSSEPMAEVSLGSIVGDDSNRVIENSTNDKIGILSHEGTDAADQSGQGDGVGQILPGEVTTRQKVPNKANLESELSPESQELTSETAGAEGRKQSQSSQGATRRTPWLREDRPARKSGRCPVASEAKGRDLAGSARVFPPYG